MFYLCIYIFTHTLSHTHIHTHTHSHLRNRIACIVSMYSCIFMCMNVLYVNLSICTRRVWWWIGTKIPPHTSPHITKHHRHTQAHDPHTLPNAWTHANHPNETTHRTSATVCRQKSKVVTGPTAIPSVHALIRRRPEAVMPWLAFCINLKFRLQQKKIQQNTWSV